MARWRITAPHYIHVADVGGGPNEWEYQEQDRNTGRMLRKRYRVPVLFDPKDTTQHNDPNGIVVSDKEDPRFPRDYVIEGQPTLDMVPLDEEAERLSKDFQEKHGGTNPIDELSGDFSSALLQRLEQQLADLIAGGVAKATAAPVTPVSLTNASEERLLKLEQQIEMLLIRNKDLEDRLSIQAEDFEPLPDIEEPTEPPPPAPVRRAGGIPRRI